MLAANYERVCGNKGYSFDVYQANIRAYEGRNRKFDIHVGSGNAWDYKADRIGYENCDYISNEIKWSFWPDTMKSLNAARVPSKSIVEQAQKHTRNNHENKNAQTEDLVLELHVPCRDPIDLLLSMANHEGSKVERVLFNCTGVETNDKLLEQEVERAYFDMNRFHARWIGADGKPQASNSIRLKCFPAIPIDPYIDYMGRFLQKRRIPSRYHNHSTNKKRDKSKECVQSLPTNIQNKIREILIKNHLYMNFCDACIGTNDQLQY